MKKNIKQNKSIILSTIDVLIVSFCIISGILIFTEYFTFTNYVKELLNLDYVDVFILSFSALGLRFLYKPKQMFTKYWKQLLFLLPGVLVLLLFIVFMRYTHIYYFLEKEDSVFEVLQVFLLVFNMFVSGFLAKFFYSKNKLLSVIFMILTLGFFFVAGEEISWGQRIFGIETPEEYAKLNTQGETTLHNYGPLFQYVYKAYAVIGFIGATAWMFVSLINKSLSKTWQTIVEALIPKWYYMTYFLIVFGYNFKRHIVNPKIGIDLGEAIFEEVMELLLFFAVTLFLTETVSKYIFKWNSNEK